MTEDLELKVGIEGEKAFIASVNHMTAAVDKMAVHVDRLDKEAKQSGQGIKQMSSNVGGASSMFSGLGAVIGGAAIVGGITAIGRAAFESAAGYESLSISLGVLLGDAQKVPGVLAEWKKFSDVTPFEPAQVNKAGKALLAFGFESEQLIPLMTKIGDVAAGTGKDFNELAIIYGKARVAGTLMSEDINQLTEAGIPIMEELAAVLGTSTDKVKKMASEGKITFPLFEQAFGRLVGSGGKFGGMMDKLSQSTEGILSTLRGEFDGLLREVGTAFLPVIKDLATAAIPAIKNALEALKPWLAELPAMFSRAKATAMGIINPLISIYDSLVRIAKPIMEAIGGFDGMSTSMSIVMPKFGLIGDALNIVAKVLGVVADAVTWMNDTWDYLVANYPKIAKAIEYITLPLQMMISPLETVSGLWDDLFGDGAESVGGLSEKSAGYLKEFSKVARDEFGASSEQMLAFSKSLKQAEFAGKSEGESLVLLKEKFAAFMAAASATKPPVTVIEETGKDAKFAAGSIGAMEEALKKLNEQFTKATTAQDRVRIGADIETLKSQIELMKAQGEAMNVTALKAESVNDAFGKMAMTTEAMTRPTGGMGTMLDMLQQIPLELETTTTAWERFQASIGGDASDILRKGIDDMKATFRSFGAQAVESMGYAIGAAGSAADAFKAVIAQMMVEVPKLAGMVLLNAAVAAGPTPVGLALGAAGLALIGLSGLLGGIQAKNAKEREDALSGIPDSASGVGGASGSIGGLGGFTGQAAQTAPIQVSINAELDGVKIGGLFKRVTTDYDKSTIKQR